MKKNQKLIIAGVSLIALYLAYKKGLFGGKSSSGPSGANTPETFSVSVPADSDAVTITPTGDPQGIIVNMLPNNFANLTPANSSMTYA